MRWEFLSHVLCMMSSQSTNILETHMTKTNAIKLGQNRADSPFFFFFQSVKYIETLKTFSLISNGYHW